MNILNENTLDMLIKTLNYNNNEKEKLDDDTLCRYWKYINILEQRESDILKNIKTVNTKDLFYSRYYWFNKFKTRFYELFGHDEGLEQKSFKILNEYDERFNDNIDWKIIEQIENNSLN